MNHWHFDLPSFLFGFALTGLWVVGVVNFGRCVRRIGRRK